MRSKPVHSVGILLLAFVLMMLAGCDGFVLVRGHIYGPDGGPLKDVRATLLTEGGDWVIGQTTTDAAGCFVFLSMVAPFRLPYRVVTTHPGYKSALAVVFSNGKVNEVDMRMLDMSAQAASSSKVIERPLASNETSYFDVRCREGPVAMNKESSDRGAVMSPPVVEWP